jgi:tetratricopeptide (TPR) repeat protein
MLSGESPEAIEIGREALAIAEQLGLAELQAHALNNIGTSKTYLRDESGKDDLERSIEVALAANSPEAARGYNNLASILAERGQFREYVRLVREAVRVGEQLGNAAVVRYARALMIDQRYLLGEWDQFRSEADQFIAACDAGDRHYNEAWIRIDRALVRLAQDDVQAALDDTSKALRRAREAGDPQAYLPVLASATYLLIEAGRLQEAQEIANELAQTLDSERAIAWMVWDAAWVAHQTGLEEPFRAFASETPGIWTDRLVAVLDRNFEFVAERTEEEGRLTPAAMAHLHAAARLISEGRRAEADVHLQKALAFYRSVGATHYVRRGEALLAASA